VVEWVEFVIGKTMVELTRERVEEVLEKLDPEPFKGKLSTTLSSTGGSSSQ
jgi:hypothetical protein